VQFRLGRNHVAVDVPHLLVLFAILGFCGWYLADARAASTDVQNLLLIEPAAILAFVFGACILREAVSITRAPPTGFGRSRLRRSMLISIIGSMLLLAAYVGSMDFIGFDVATAAYILAMLLLLGERRPAVLLIGPILFAAVAVIGFQAVVSIPMPLALF